MAYYDKKIVYLSYMEHGQRMSGAGFIKLEEYDTYASVEVMVKGIGKNIHKMAQVLVINVRGEAKPIGTIEIKSGEGKWRGTTEKNSAAAAIKINLDDGKVIECKLAESKQTEEKMVRKEALLKTAEWEDKSKTAEKAEKQKKGHIEEQNKVSNKPDKKLARKEEKREEENETEWERRQIPLDMEQVISTDKWKQLMQLYPVVHPYEDDRAYISIEPKDFVVMSGNYQHLANNSFLLHGFYNYRHIILGKEKGGETELVYLGVPGVYYEREKMVALMFGFEAFECAGGIAQQGKFGYYLRQVQI